MVWNTQPGLQPFIEGHRCYKRVGNLSLVSLPERAGLQAAPRTHRLKVWCRFGRYFCELPPRKMQVTFPFIRALCTGFVILSAMTKGSFLCAPIPFVHKSKRCSHEKLVFLL